MTTDAGRQRAFEAAAETRRRRAEFEALVETGGVDLDGIFARADDDPVIGEMKLLPLLEALPGVGKVQSRRALEQAGVAEKARAGAVTVERRAALGRALLDPDTRP